MTTDKATLAPEPQPASASNKQSDPPGGLWGRRVGSWLAQIWSALAMPLLAIVLALIVGAVRHSADQRASTRRDYGLRPSGSRLPGTLARLIGQRKRPGVDARSGRATDARWSGCWPGLQGRPVQYRRTPASSSSAPWSAVAGAIIVAGQPPIIAIPFALLCGALGGALWGFIPGFLKAFSGAHEVVTTIMLNYISYALISWAVSGPLRQPRAPQAVTPDVGNAALPILFGRDGHLGIVLAFIAVPIVWFLLYRMTIGFQIRAVGANPDASRYAGMKPRRLIIFAMSAAGLLAGLAGTINILGINHTMKPTTNTIVGFDAITVALLGRSHPVGIMLAALLFGGLACGLARDAGVCRRPGGAGRACSRRSSCSSWSSARSCVASSICEE